MGQQRSPSGTVTAQILQIEAMALPVTIRQDLAVLEGEAEPSEAWKIVDRWDGSDGFLRVETQLLELPDGRRGKWEIFGPEATISVLAVTPENQVVLAREFRPGPWRLLDELPGGRVEPDEDVLEAGARELLEETGYAGAIELAGSCWVAAACRTQRHVAVVRDAVRVAEPEPDGGELIEVVLVGLGEFRDRVRHGQSTNTACAYIALDHLGHLGR